MRRGQVCGLDLGFPAGHVARHRRPAPPARSWGALMGARWWIRTAVTVTLCGLASALITFVVIFLVASTVLDWTSP